MHAYIGDHPRTAQIPIRPGQHDDSAAILALIKALTERSAGKNETPTGAQVEARILAFWKRILARTQGVFSPYCLVTDDDGARFENAAARMLLKPAQHQMDIKGLNTNLHYIRTKDSAEVGFCICQDGALTNRIEHKESDSKPHRTLARDSRASSTRRGLSRLFGI